MTPRALPDQPRLLCDRTVRPAFPLIVSLALLAAFGCGSGDDVTNSDGGGTSTNSLPDELVATWHLEQAGEPVCDPDTGLCTTSFARSETLELGADGVFQHSLFAESNFPPCSLTAHHQSTGTAEVDGSTLRLHIRDGLTSIQDNCGQGGDTDESGKTYSYTFEVTQGAGGVPQLMLTDDKGDAIGPFEPQ